MPAYLLFLREAPVRDAAEMAIYGEMNRSNPRDPKLLPLSVYGAIEALEGEAPDGAVLLQFPTAEDARAWYESPAYQAAKVHRLKGADYRAMIIQGL
ncbi:DUF1330 domain-containing protein [Hydrocarboniphaga sp.]|uniref:DUF1330 domain-containing protein n=1 Tax=Hydrocarboniphaga sp. TaxID=2033016 RepID=UPI003D0E61EA